MVSFAKRFTAIAAVTDNAEKALMKEVYQRALQNKTEFKRYVQQLPFGLDSTKEFFYETIWNNEPHKWENFLSEELKLLFKAASLGQQEVIEDMGSMIYLTDFEGGSRRFYDDVIQFVLPDLDSEYIEVRKSAFDGIISSIDYGKVEISTIDKMKLQALLKDKSWTIRKWVYLDLKELKMLPDGFNLSFLDTIRMKFYSI